MAKLKFKKGYSDVGVFPLLSHVLKEGGLIVDDEDFELNPATSLTGEEKVKILQDGKTLLTTTQDIAALAGGGSSFIPNGIKVITESRDLQADDAGYALMLNGENPVILTIPYNSPLQAGESFIVFSEFSVPGNYVIYGEGIQVLLANGETVLFTTTVLSVEDNFNLSLLVSTINVDGEGGQPNKTALRYLMDNVGNTGTATLVAGTVTVANERVRTGAKIIVSVNTPGGTQGFLSAPSGSIVDETSFVINSSSATETSTVNYWFVNP